MNKDINQPERFNLRVYALIIKNGEILLADESINGFSFTKFPGGGVELGEGLIDALKRELMEEGGLEIETSEHFYTTDFYQESAFNPNEQIVSVYYKVKTDIDWDEKSSDQSVPGKDHQLKLYFRPLNEVDASLFTFPIDRKVIELLSYPNLHSII